MIMKKVVLLFLFVFLLGMSIVLADVDVLVQQVERAIKEYESKTGEVPGEDIVAEILSRYADVLSGTGDTLQIRLVDDNMGDPPITKSALRLLFEAKVQSINSFKIEYTVDTSGIDKKKLNRDACRSVTCIMDKNRFYAESTFTNDPEINQAGISREIFAHDGKNISIARFFFDNGRVVEGSISHFRDLAELLPNGFPLYYSFLLAPETQKLAEFAPILDLSALLSGDAGYAFVGEKTEIVNGQECVFVSNVATDIYLDISKDYSVVKMVWNQLTTDFIDGGRKIVPYKTVNMTDHIDCGNGIWIPRKIVVLSAFEGEVGMKTTMTISIAKLNEKFEDSIFVNIFPEDALIADAVSNLVYEWGEKASIDSLLKATAKSKRVWIFQYISMTIGIFMIIAWCILKYLAHRKRKNSDLEQKNST